MTFLPMKRHRRTLQPVLSVTLALASLSSLTAVVACGSKDTEVEERERELAAYNALGDVAGAPDLIRAQVNSVVLIELENASGTGFWVKVPSLGRVVLATNFHVIGRDACALQGCYVTLVTGAERGAKEAPNKVFVVPAAASSNYDVAFYDVYGSKEDALAKRAPMRSATGLSLDPSLRPSGTLYVVGHPAGGLKKVSVGTLIRNDATDSRSTNFTLGGNSGSPVLDASGRLVGLLWAALLTTQTSAQRALLTRRSSHETKSSRPPLHPPRFLRRSTWTPPRKQRSMPLWKTARCS